MQEARILGAEEIESFEFQAGSQKRLITPKRDGPYFGLVWRHAYTLCARSQRI